MSAAADGIPRGALAVVVVGLLLSVATALLTVDEDEGGERIDWERSAEIADSDTGRLGRDGSLQLTDARLDATRENASGFSLFRVFGTLALDLGAIDGRAEAACTVEVPQRSVLARTPDKRAAYPLPSDDLLKPGRARALDRPLQRQGHRHRRRRGRGRLRGVHRRRRRDGRVGRPTGRASRPGNGSSSLPSEASR